MLLWLGWQRHCVVKSGAREKYQNRTWFTIRIRRHMFDESRMHPGGEKPECQQHNCSRHAHKKHSRTRGVAKTKNAKRNEGAKQKKKWTARRAGTRFLCFATPPGREQQNIRKVSFCIRTEHDKLHAFHKLKWRKSQRVGESMKKILVSWIAKTKRFVREGLKKWKYWAARSVRTRIYFAYLQHGDAILVFVNTLNEILRFLASGRPTESLRRILFF